MRKTIYEIVSNNTGMLIETFSFSVSIRKGTAYEITDDKTGKFIESFPFSIRVRVRLTDVDEYKKTHVLLNRLG